MSVHLNDTIYALSTASGKSGLAVVRISGPAAADVARNLFGSLPPARVATLSTFRSLIDGEVLDRGLVLWFPGPGSFTGEDVVELHLHGSIGIVRSVLDELRVGAGLRPAGAGEFSRRAFLNGKLDLVEAEGLSDILEAETKSQVRQALFHVDGRASEVFSQWRLGIVDALSLVEACIDFSDEEHVASAAGLRIEQAVCELRGCMAKELAGFDRGRRIRLGARVVLAGAPNVGKSSLMNSIAASDVAIVSKHAGTTRDVIEVSLDLGGYAVDLADTAGIREQFDSEVEQIGIERSVARVKEADLVLLVASIDEKWPDLLIDSDTIRVWNKSDMAPPPNDLDVDVSVSALTGDGLSELLSLIESRLSLTAGRFEPTLLVRDRQVHAVEQCIVYLDAALAKDLPLELMAEELRMAAFGLECLLGKVDVEELLDEIFSKFCVGK